MDHATRVCEAVVVKWSLIVMTACSAPARPSSERVTVAAPIIDTDRDRIADVDDACPADAETYNGTDDDDGCPDRPCVLVRQFPLCVDERIYYKRGETSVAPMFAHVVDQLVRTMEAANADIETLAIRGVRDDGEPIVLSLARAKVMRDALVARGVDATRLELVDGGVDAQRRVEVVITKQRVAYDDADEIVCTPAGRWFVKLDDAEKRARCEARRTR